MSEPDQKSDQNQRVKILWFYAYWKVITAVVLVVGGCLPTVILGWDTMIASGKLVAVGGLILSAWKAADIEIRQILRRLAEGKPPVDIPNGNGDSGHTQQFQKPDK